MFIKTCFFIKNIITYIKSKINICYYMNNQTKRGKIKIIVKGKEKPKENKKGIIIDINENDQQEIKLLKNDGNKIKTIIHISDIHIYLPIDNNRLVEYTQVLENLYTEINEQKKKTPELIICITGDLCHKNKLYGKEIDFVERFLTKLCEMGIVVIIPGNHDYNNFESSELTFIAPIMRNKKTKHEFYLLTQDGLYQLNNIIFGVTSVFSKIVTKCHHINDPNLKKIALYHGHVFSKKIKDVVPDKDYYFKIKEFDSYDMCLFGDIHVPCSLSDDNSRWYAGSLIQQQEKEKLNHGCIIWDVENNRGEFKKIKNDYGFLTLEIDENGIKNYENLDIPKFAKLDCYYKNVDYKKAKDFLEEVERKFNVNIEPQLDLELKFGNTKQLNNNNNNDNNNNVLENDLSKIKSIDGMKNLILNYIKEKEKGKDYSRIEIILNEILKEINYNPNNKQKKIKLMELKFDNFFSYGENNYINFEDMSGITLNISGKNSTGKTSLFDVILFSLFGRCTRGKVLDYINVNKNKLKTDIMLKVNDDEFRIIRERKRKVDLVDENTTFIHKKRRKASYETPTTSTEIYKNGKKLTSDKFEDTSKYINDTIGTYDDFLNTCFILQSIDSSFFKMADSKQIDFIMKYLNLDILSHICDILKDKINDNRSNMSSICKNYGIKLTQMDKVLNLLKKMINDNTKLLKSNDEELIKLNNIFKKLRDEMMDYHKLLIENEVKLKDFEELKVDKKEFNDSDKQYNLKLKESNNTKEKLDILIKQNNKLKNDKNKHIKKLEKFTNIDEEKNNFDKQKELSINNLEDKLEELLSSKKNIDFCENIRKIKNDKEGIQNSLNNLISKRDEILINLQTYENKIIDIKNKDEYLEKYNEYNNLQNFISDLQKEIDALNKENENYNKNSNLDLLKKLEYNNKCKCCKHNEELLSSINFNIIIEKNNNIIKKNNKQIGTNNKKLIKLKKAYDQHIQLCDDYNNNNIINDKMNVLKNEIIIIEKEITIQENKYSDLERNIKLGEEKENNIEFNKKIEQECREVRKQLKILRGKEFTKYKEYNDVNKKITYIEEKYKNNEYEIISLEKHFNTLNIEIVKLKNVIDKYNMNKEKIKEYDSIKDQHQTYFDKYNSTLCKLDDIEKTIIEKEKIKHDCITKQSNFDRDIKEFNDRTYDNAMYLKLKTYLKDEDGIQISILNNKIFPHLENIINGILAQIVDFKIKFYCEGPQSFRISKQYINGRELNIETLSCSEDHILDIIFRIGLSYFNNVLRTNFFIMDENFSVFDGGRLDLLVNKLFVYLKKYYDIILIVSHIQDVKDACDDEIIIKRNNKGFSEIEYKK